MPTLEQTRTLRVLSETRDALKAGQDRLVVDDIAAGAAIADALDILDDAIVAEYRAQPSTPAGEAPYSPVIRETMLEAVKDAWEELNRVSDLLFEFDGETSHGTVSAHLADLFDRLRAGGVRDTQRLDWWFERGLTDSVCEGSVDLWWADEINGNVVERVTHGTSVRDALDKAMRGEYEPG